MARPLIITDCDEVLMHMVVPFQTWLDEEHGIHFDLSSRFEEALRHKHSNDPVERRHVWLLLGAFLKDEMWRQYPIEGAIASISALAEQGDVVVLTNIRDEAMPGRRAQLDAHGLHFPVIGNQGGKGPALVRLVEAYRPSVALFIDDLESNHESVAAEAPDVWRLQLVGEPLIAPYAPTSPDAHARIDRWADAMPWITARLADGPAP